MDDLNRRLEDILNDPESMKKVRQMAGALLEDDEPREEESETDESPFSGADIGRIMGVLNRVGKSTDDNRAKLLLALKPHLTDKRRRKVDTALKLLKLIEALPLLKEAGILDLGLHDLG